MVLPKGPAPVLPATGLHSFHNDSPPFAGTANAEHPHPPALSLEDAYLQQSAAMDDDAELSSRRSRRLVTGYRMGNPPSPRQGLRDDDSVSRDSDSPPLTVNSELEAEDAEAGGIPGIPGGVPALPLPAGAIPTQVRRRSERASGFDLAGLHDGEADADHRAPRAPVESAAYLRGEAPYAFPRHRLRRSMKDEGKIPLVIVACGSFSPPTYLHLRMFEMAKDEIVESQTYEIMAGYYSPVSSYYKKSGLAPALDRVRMCELAVEHTSTWLMVDPWEAGQGEYQRTAVVLDHFDEMLNGADGEGGVEMADGSRRKYKIMLLAGGDLIESFGEPGVWAEPDLHHILGGYGCLIVERTGSDVWSFLLSHDILYHHRRNVIVVKQLIYNDISSSKVRLFVRRGMSIKYLLPNSVIQYIHDKRLYRESDARATLVNK